MHELGDFPREILEISLGYMPSDTLITLLDIPQVETLARRLLYTTIRIGGKFYDRRLLEDDEDDDYDEEDYEDRIKSKYLRVGHRPQIIDGIPVLKSAMEYYHLRKSNPNVRPSKLIFDDVMTAVLIAHTSPEILENTHIELIFTPDFNFSLFCSEYKRAPFTVSSLVNFDPCEENRDLDLFRNVTSYTSTSKRDFKMDMRDLSPRWFPNLKELKIEQQLTLAHIAMLPKQITSLSLYIHLDGTESNGALKLGLPQLLEDLKIKVVNETSNMMHIDISHLQLNSLIIDGCSKFRYGDGGLKWLVPSLRKLSYDASHFMAKPLKHMCPQLLELNVGSINGESSVPGNYLNNLPSSLVALMVPANAFNYPKMETKKQKFESANLPSNLRKLELTGRPYGNDGAYIDFEMNKLCNLTTLSIIDVPEISICGSLPPSITSLTLHLVKSFGFNMLQHLHMLRDLEIKRSDKSSSNFNYKLPQSLTSLKISYCDLKAINIDAPKLELLVIDGEEIQSLTKSNFRIPGNLKKLRVSNSKVREILIDFPTTLKELDLSQNSLGVFGRGKKASSFPVGLEILDLSHNNISDEWIRRLNLLELNHLKSLYLGHNRLVYLVPEFLPSSLVALDASNNGVIAFADFDNTPNLEQLDLSFTKLSGFLLQLKGKDKDLPESIKFVSIQGFGLSYEEVEVFYNILAKKPNFEYLNLYEAPIDALMVLGKGAKLSKVGLLGGPGGFISVN